METQTTKLHPLSDMAARTAQRNGRAYDKAWTRFDRLSAKLRGTWKTKKNTLQILKEERR